MTEGIFSYRRRVGFGECDSARIYFAPHAIDYAVEAVESWYESVLGVSWVAMVDRHGLEATIEHIECEYKRPLVADQMFQVRVRVVRIGPSQITFSAAGEGDSGDTYFRVRLVASFLLRNHGIPIRIPPEFLDRIGMYRERCGEVGTLPDDDDPPDNVPTRPMGGAGRERTRQLHPLQSRPTGAVPFARQRRVHYGACGPSGKIYPPKVFEFVVETVGEWFVEVPGISWLELTAKRGQGSPIVSAACEYFLPMTPGQMITIVVRVPRLGRASIGYEVAGYDADGEPCFESQLTSCFIDQNTGFRPMPIPEEFRRRIQAYRAASGDA